MADLSILIQAKDAASAVLKQVSQNVKQLGTGGRASMSQLAGVSGQLKQGLAQVRAESGALQEKWSGLAETSRAIGVGITAMGAAITASLGAAVSSTVNYGNQVDKISKTSGVSTEAVQKLGFAAQQEHASIDTLAGGLNLLSRSMKAAAAQKKGGAVDADVEVQGTLGAFRELGIAVTDTQGKLRSSQDVLLDVADRFKTMSDGPAKAALAMKLFGRGGAELVPFLSLGRQAITELGVEAEQLGLVMSGSAVAAAEQFGDSWDKLKGGLQGIALQIGSALLPILNGLVQTILPIIKAITGWMQAHPGLTAAILTVVGVIGTLMTVIGPLLIALPTLIGLWGSLTAGLALVGPLLVGAKVALLGILAVGGPVIAVVAAIAAAAFLVIKYWEPIKFFFIGLWETIKEIFSSAWEWIKGIIDKVKGAVGSVIETVKKIPGAATLAGVIPGVGPAFQAAAAVSSAQGGGNGPGPGIRRNSRGQIMIDAPDVVTRNQVGSLFERYNRLLAIG